MVRKMFTVRLYNIYLRCLLLIYWIGSVWHRVILGLAVENTDGVYVRVRGKLVRLELYPSHSGEIRIGDNRYTTIRPQRTVEVESDQD